MEKPIVKTLSVSMGINASEQKMEAFKKIAVIVIGGGQVQIKRPILWVLAKSSPNICVSFLISSASRGAIAGTFPATFCEQTKKVRRIYANKISSHSFLMKRIKVEELLTFQNSFAKLKNQMTTVTNASNWERNSFVVHGFCSLPRDTVTACFSRFAVSLDN